MSGATDRLTNAERPAGDRPAPAPSDNTSATSANLEGYWYGSAAGEVARWRSRALAAEATVVELRRPQPP